MGIVGGELLSKADAAWLHADTPTNHFIVTSLALFDEPVDVDRLKDVMARRIAMHPRLHQVVSEAPVVGPRWMEAADFDVDAHVHRVALPHPRGKAELMTFIGDLVGQPIDVGRPLWHLYAVEGPGAGGALVTRLHHSLGDGHALVRVLLTLTDDTADGWKRKPPRPGRRRSRSRPRSRGFSALDAATGLPRLALRGADWLGTLGRLTLMDPDPPSPLRGRLTMMKAVSWTDPIGLDAIKRVAAASGTTVNDVVVSAIAGGVGAYLRDITVDTRGLRIRAMVPVDLRTASDTRMTGNQFSLVYLELPVGAADPWERLMRVKIEMDRIKASQEPGVGWLLVQGLGILPPRAEHVVSSFYGAKASIVLTNVMGPRQRLYMAGVPIRQMTFWEPESGGLGVGISIYSYAGDVTVAVVADRRLVPEPERITRLVTRSFDELARVAA